MLISSAVIVISLPARSRSSTHHSNYQAHHGVTNSSHEVTTETYFPPSVAHMSEQCGQRRRNCQRSRYALSLISAALRRTLLSPGTVSVTLVPRNISGIVRIFLWRQNLERSTQKHSIIPGPTESLLVEV
jgi:hypothetical protein